MRETFLDKYQILATWDDKIEFVRRMKKIPGARFKKPVLDAFKYEICQYNRKRKVDEPIRSILTGRLIGPSSGSYLKTLRACNLVRHYSICGDKTGKHPVRGRLVVSKLEKIRLHKGCKRLTRRG